MKNLIIVYLVLLPYIIKAQYPASTGNNTNYEYISNVTFNTINNNSTGSDADGDGDDGYDDYTSQSTTLTPGNSYTLSVTISPDAKEYVKAWIDWNDNGNFTDAGEEYTLASNTSSSGPFSVTVTVPASAVDISTRLRVSLKWNGVPASDENFSYGEVEDYTVSTYTDTDNDGIPDITDIDDDGDGITDAAEAGVTCTTTEVYYGANNGYMYKLDFGNKTEKLMTTSPYTSGYINTLASNPDAGVVYYGVGTTIYVYEPASGSHSIVQDLSGLISGGNLESGGAAYLDGYLYIGPEDGSYYGTYVYKIPVSSDGKSFTGSPVSIGNLAGSSKGWGDFVIIKNGTSGIIYGQSADPSSGNGEFWKYDLSSGTKTIIRTTTGGTWQLALDLYGRLWKGVSTTLQKIDFDGDTYGSTYTVSDDVSDMTGPFNCVQGDFSLDSDGDGIANIIDLDSDGDGIPDNVEAQSTSGYTAPSGTDTDGDGLDDNYDPDNGGTYIGYIDTDNDGTYDYLDLNSDNQGGNDTQEAGLSLSGSDSDGDGLDNSTDATSDYSDPNGTINNPSSLPDSDSDVSSGGDVDYRDNFDGDADDHDGDGIPDDKDIDDDNDGITDAEEMGVTCGVTEIYVGGNNGKIYKVNFSTGSVTLMTTSTISGITYINALASNPDDEVVYYGDGTSVYVYDPSTGNHSFLKDFSSEISGGNLEYGGAAYYNGYLYIAPEDGNGYGTYIYKIPVSNNGMTLGTAQSIGSPSGSGKSYGDFVVSSDNSTGVIYGSTGASGSSDYWKYDINSGVKTVISSPSTNPYQVAVDLYGRKWGAVGTTLRKLDKDGNFYGSTITLTEDAIDMTGPYNCPQGDMSLDTDGDGVPDIYDLDSDNDGVPDVVEAGGSDPDHDGRIGSGSITDTDGDGLDDSVDPDNGGTALSKPDTDNDGIKDYLDLDSDDDGIPDNVETQSTTGYVSPSSTDDDGDGWDDNYEPSEGGSYIDPQDTDGDGTDDYLSQDSDGDGVDDNSESGITLSGNDSDGDGLDDNVDQTSDYSDPNGSINNPSTDLPDSDGDVNGSGDVDYRDDTDDSGSLPINLINLKVEMAGDVAVVTWVTNSETNNDYYIVQRSKNGNKWENIDKVKGAGNSNVVLNYTVFDNNPLFGVSYYRIVQFDFDGTSEISKTVQLINNSESNKLSIYPNPAEGYVNIFVAETAIIKIVAANGRLVINKQMNAGQNKLDIHDVKPGIYYVKVVMDDNVVVRKLIIK